MRDSHEASEGWSTEDSVVLRRPVDHFELDSFSPIIFLRPEDNVEADLSQRNFGLAWDDAVERGVSCFEVGQGYVHGPQRSGEDEVKAAASIHEDFAHVETSDLGFEY